MAATGFAFLILFWVTSRMIGSELAPESKPSILEGITTLNQMMSELQNSFSSIPLTIQAANEEMLLYILDKMTNNSEALRTEFQVLLSNHSLCVEQLEQDIAQMNQKLGNQTILIEKLSQQLKDVQSFKTCAGEPPSQQDGIPVDFGQKHGSGVRYRCDLNFTQAENSTVIKSITAHPEAFIGGFPLRAYGIGATKISCFNEESFQNIIFSRVLDIGSGVALPKGARTYSRGRAAVLDLSGVPGKDSSGVYECGYVMDGKRAGNTFVIDPLGLYLRPEVASVGDTVQFRHVSFNDSSYRWLHDGKHVPAWDGRSNVEIADVGTGDAGVYERYKEGHRRRNQWFYRLLVRGCPADFFGELCDQNCPSCYNGGVCHQKLGTCICPPGFRGERCEVACGRNQLGPNCSESCDGGSCSDHLFCRPDPYGCSCVSGYDGYRCSFICNPGKFGADCKQTCHCKEDSCDPFTGVCFGGCSQGWKGPSCQIPVET